MTDVQVDIMEDVAIRERTYRLALRSWWGMGQEQGIPAFQAALAAVREVEAALPEGKVTAILEAEALMWIKSYGVCPWCGGVGPHPLALPLEEGTS
jgi:hypothetical protein